MSSCILHFFTHRIFQIGELAIYSPSTSSVHTASQHQQNLLHLLPHHMSENHEELTIPNTVVPGQYIVPECKPHQGAGGPEVHRYLSGKGTTISSITSGSQSVPVVAATVLGRPLIQEVVDDDKNGENVEGAADAADDAVQRTFLVSVITSAGDYASYAAELDPLAANATSSSSTNLPREGDVVLVRITRLNPKQANCDILAVCGAGNVASDGGVGSTGASAHFSVPMGGGAQLLSSYASVAAAQGTMSGAQPYDVGEAFRGVIRSQDVRSTDRDKVRIIDSFRPGDIVRAEVLSLGDGLNYYLTTAKNEYGVVFAKSEGGAGDLMTAIDWETMVCERTGVVEKRKCAKLF